MFRNMQKEIILSIDTNKIRNVDVEVTTSLSSTVIDSEGTSIMHSDVDYKFTSLSDCCDHKSKHHQ